MYYISAEGTTSPARKVKRLSDFTRNNKNAEEGSLWSVRTKREVEFLDALDTYEIKNGKLKKTNEASLFWI